MRTGFGDAGDGLTQRYIQSMIDIVEPVVKQSIILSAEYCTASGRTMVTAQDMEYAMKYCTMYEVGRTTHQEEEEEETDDEEEEEEVEEEEEEEEEEPFTRYSGNDPKFLNINEAYDNWDVWQPRNPVEVMLKNSINSRI